MTNSPYQKNRVRFHQTVLELTENGQGLGQIFKNCNNCLSKDLEGIRDGKR